MNDGPNAGELEAWLKEAIGAMADGFAIYDSDGRLAYCNDSFRRIHGYSDTDTRPGVATYDRLGWLDNAHTTDRRVPKTFEQRVAQLRRDGPSGIVQTFGDRVYERHLSVTPSGGLISIVTDITALKEAQQEAVNADRAKSEFLASMSHELRTPLNAIIGFAQLIATETFGAHANAKYGEYARDIQDSGEHLISIVNDILDLSKIEAGEVAQNPTKFGLRRAIDECVRMFEYQHDDHAGRIHIRVSEDTPELFADERIFRQIVINLLSNADKYTPEGGEIRISSKPGAGGSIVITIADTGIGIAPEDLRRVLEPFGQARTNAEVAHKGTGLGLSLSKKLMELQGGRLEIGSAPNVGTTITLTFPPCPDG